MNAELQAQLANILGTLQKGAVEYAPKAWELAQQLKWVDSVGGIIANLLGLLIGAGVLLLIIRKGIPKRMGDYAHEAAWDIGLLIAGALGATVVIISFFSLFDVWMWVGAFRPDLAIAHDLLMKVAGK